MNKIIPILPCINIKSQVEFYEQLGFDVIAIFTAPGGYAVLKYQDIELNFWATKKLLPEENSCMTAILVDDVDMLNQVFCDNLKKNLGKIPRSGFPKITKVRDLKDDRRFTLTDPSGNTFYIMSRNDENSSCSFRVLDNQEHAANFAILYDLVYSKEDKKVATNMLNMMLDIEKILSGKDLIKFLIVKMDIRGFNSETYAKISLEITNNSFDEKFTKDVKRKIEEMTESHI